MRKQFFSLFSDIIIETEPNTIILVRRPETQSWCLPGGFLDAHETPAQAALREALEETSLTVTLKEQFHTYSFTTKNRRCRGITTVFTAISHGVPVGGDDVTEACAFSIYRLPDIVADHQQIVRDYVRWRKTGIRPDAHSEIRISVESPRSTSQVPQTTPLLRQ